MGALRMIAGLVVAFLGLNVALLPRAIEYYVFQNVDVKDREEKHVQLMEHFKDYNLYYLLMGLVIEVIALWVIFG